MTTSKPSSLKFMTVLRELEEAGADEGLLKKLGNEYELLSSHYSRREKEMQRFEVMFDRSPCTISWIDSNLNYLGVNKTLCESFGLGAEDFIGKKVGSHSQERSFMKFAAILFDCPRDNHILEATVTAKGKKRSFYLMGSKLPQGDEAIIIGLDVTEFVQMKKNIELMGRLSSLGEMVTGIVHEINNPLTIIKNRAQRISKFIKSDEREKAINDIQSVEMTCQKIEKIIEGVKTFVRPGDDDPYTREDIRGNLDQAISMLESKLKKSSIKVNLPQNKIPEIMANHTQLHQIFVNLISNSIDALSESCRERNEEVCSCWITIEYEESDHFHRLRFIDSGKGIPLECQENIFDSFYTSKARGRGTGLGLSLCKKIANSHGGNIFIDNECENTCFTVEIPKYHSMAA